MQADGRGRADGGLVRARPPSSQLAPELQWIILGGKPVLPQGEGRGPARSGHALACALACPPPLPAPAPLPNPSCTSVSRGPP